ncbi:MAG TPA: hypothetical protein VGU27_05965, partial [Candidatus Eisenbacteria bacterium]|nr:hypothetical protein [Candidatus Eisenbacteria bacterium]
RVRTVRGGRGGGGAMRAAGVAGDDGGGRGGGAVRAARVAGGRRGRGRSGGLRTTGGHRLRGPLALRAHRGGLRCGGRAAARVRGGGGGGGGGVRAARGAIGGGGVVPVTGERDRGGPAEAEREGTGKESQRLHDRPPGRWWRGDRPTRPRLRAAETTTRKIIGWPGKILSPGFAAGVTEVQKGSRAAAIPGSQRVARGGVARAAPPAPGACAVAPEVRDGGRATRR